MTSPQNGDCRAYDPSVRAYRLVRPEKGEAGNNMTGPVIDHLQDMFVALLVAQGAPSPAIYDTREHCADTPGHLVPEHRPCIMHTVLRYITAHRDETLPSYCGPW